MKLKKRYPDANITYYIYICLTSCGKGHRSRCLIACSHASNQVLFGSMQPCFQTKIKQYAVLGRALHLGPQNTNFTVAQYIRERF